MRSTLRKHWPEYLMEAGGLGVFMLSACGFGTLLGYPGSPVVRAIPSPMLRQILMGLAMGLTNLGIIYSPWGQRSGAHLNPAVTLTFYRLGKVAPWDAVFYALSQFIGGILGVQIAALALGMALRQPPVMHVVTLPGSGGPLVAFLAEVVITFLLMTVVLHISNTRRIARYTGLFASMLVMAYISLEAPLSGMSMNPARTFGSAFAAHLWTALWVYFIAPPLGMLLAAELYVQRKGLESVFCAKLHHQNPTRCIFCAYQSMRQIDREPN
jgi:aquaporin Z